MFYPHVRNASQPRARSAKKRRIDDSDDEGVEYVISSPTSGSPSISSWSCPAHLSDRRSPRKPRVPCLVRPQKGVWCAKIGDIPCAHLFDFVKIAMSSRRETPICLSMPGRKMSSRPSAMRLPQISPIAPLIPILHPLLLMVRLGPASSPKTHRTRLSPFHLNVHETWSKLSMQGTTKPANSTPKGQPQIPISHTGMQMKRSRTREKEVNEHFVELREWMRSVYMHWHVSSVEEVRIDRHKETSAVEYVIRLRVS